MEGEISMTKLLVLDPGVSTGIARFEKIKYEQQIYWVLKCIGTKDLESMYDGLVRLRDCDLVVLESFSNPFTTLTKEATATLELIGAIKYACKLKQIELVSQPTSIKQGYLLYAKQLQAIIPLVELTGTRSKHSSDAIAHGLRYLCKNCEAEVTKIVKVTRETQSILN